MRRLAAARYGARSVQCIRMSDHKSQRAADDLASALESISRDGADAHVEMTESIVPGQIEQRAASGETPAGDPIARRRPTSDALDDLAACEAPLADQASRPVRPPIPGATTMPKGPLRPPAPGMRAVTVVPSKAPKPSLHAPRPEFPMLARDDASLRQIEDDLAKAQATIEEPPPPRPERPHAPVAETPTVEPVPSEEPAPLVNLVQASKSERAADPAPVAPVQVPEPVDVPSPAVPSEPEMVTGPLVAHLSPPPTPAPAPADGSFVMNDEDQDLIPELAAAMQTNAAPADMTSLGAASAQTSSARRRARQRQALLDSLFVRRTLIPILLTLGLLMPALGSAWFLLPPESPFKQSGSELPLAMLVIGPVFLVVAILNILQVRSALARLR